MANDVIDAEVIEATSTDASAPALPPEVKGLIDTEKTRAFWRGATIFGLFGYFLGAGVGAWAMSRRRQAPRSVDKAPDLPPIGGEGTNGEY